MAQYPRKLKDGIRYWYKFDYNGKTYFSKAIYLTKIEARKAEAARYDELATQEREPSKKPILSLTDAINERLDYVKAKKSNKYYLECLKHYKALLNSLGDVAITDITKAHINAHLVKLSESLKSRGKDNYTVNCALRVNKALFNHAIENHDLEIKNPCVSIALYPIKAKLKYIPSDTEIEAVKKQCDELQCLLIDFVMETGARIGEALRITGADMFDGYVVLYTHKSYNSNLIPRKAYHSLQLPAVKNNERLFSRWSEAPRYLEDKVKQLGQRKWNWHNLRHRFASKLSKSGTPLFEIMLKLGHTQISTTQSYLQLLP